MREDAHGGPGPRSGSPAAAFQIFPIVNSLYAEASWPELEDAEQEATRIADILSYWGGRLEPWECEARQRVVGEVLARLKSWSTPPDSRSSLVLWIGHGESNNDDASLIVRATDDTDTSIDAATFAKYVVTEQRRRNRSDWAIVVIEACGSGRFAELLGVELLRQRARDGVLVIGTGTDRGRGHLGTFRRVLEQVRDTYYSNDTVVTLSDLSGRIDMLMESGDVVSGSFRGCSPLVPAHAVTPTVTTPVDLYPDLRDVLETLPASDLRHLARKGGGADLLEMGGYFAGRSDERAEILSWFQSHDQGLLVLTGEPGSGKSALLGNVLLNAIPRLRQVLRATPHLGSDWPEADRLPEIDGAVLLTGAGTRDVVTRIAAIAGIEPPDDVAPEKAAERVLQLVSHRRPPLAIVADALDEARDPIEIATLLARIGSLPGVRIVLATRPEVGQFKTDLIGFLRQAVPDVRVVTVARDEQAMAEFIRASLAASAGDVPRDELGRALEDIRAAVSGGQAVDDRWDFLHVRLLVRELVADRRLLTDGAADERRGLLGLDRPALFDRAFVRITRSVSQARPLLLALAYARGRGLPRADRVWTTVAEALEPAERFTEADVQQVLKVAGPYIMLDAEHGRSVFRLAHRTFGDQLIGPDPGVEKRLSVFRALLGLAREAAEPNPYLLHHLAGHAAAAGRSGWDALGDTPDVLDRLDLSSLLSDTWRVARDELPVSVQGVYRTGHLAASGGPEDRRGYRQLGIARTGGVLASAGEEDGASLAPAWQVRSARLALHPQHLTLTWPRGVPVRALTMCAGLAGWGVLAAGDDRGRIRLWSPPGFEPVELPFPGDGSSEILALTSVHDGQGDVRLVSVGHDKPARVWGMGSGSRPHSLPDLGAGTGCVVAHCPLPSTQPLGDRCQPAPERGHLVAIGTTGGHLALWDVVTRRRSGRRFVGHAGRITGLAAIPDTTRSLLVSVGYDRSLRVWNTATSRQIVEPAQWDAPLRSVVAVPAAGLLLTGDDRGRIATWRLDGLEHQRFFSAHDGPIDAMAVLPARRECPARVVSGGADGAVRIWDPLTGTRVGPDLTGHADAVTCLAVLAPENGLVRVASGSRDATIRIWSPDHQPADGIEVAATPVRARRQTARQWLLQGARGEPVTVSVGDDGALRCRQDDGPDVVLHASASLRPRCAVAFANGETTVLAIGADDAIVRTWVVPSGAPAGPELGGHENWVHALAVLAAPGAEPILVSGDDDGLVRFWEARTGTLRHQIRFGAPIRSLCASDTTGRNLTVSLDEGEVMIELSERILAPTTGGPQA